jgi:hypothetical protein
LLSVQNASLLDEHSSNFASFAGFLVFAKREEYAITESAKKFWHTVATSYFK